MIVIKKSFINQTLFIMKKTIFFICLFLTCVVASYSQAYYTGEYPNLFKDLLGKEDSEIDELVSNIVDHYFFGSGKVYYDYITTPGAEEAYIYDDGNLDTRSEGMSYGMMIAVQMDMQDTFDALWRFAKNHMQHTSGSRIGYFKWAVKVNTSDKTISVVDQNPAPDGEAYFITALLLASDRWGNGSGIFNYRSEAEYILDNASNKTGVDGVTNMFNSSNNLITFQPISPNDQFTDPSYHLPAFFDLWADKTGDDKWADYADASRAFFSVAARSPHGLMADYSDFDGTPHPSSWNSNSQYYYTDAHRCIMNMAFDWSWFQEDADEITLCADLQNFFYSKGFSTYDPHYEMDGDPINPETWQAVSQVACNAVGSLASNSSHRTEFVEALWNTSGRTGNYLYYDGMLHMLSLLHCSGKFRASWDGGDVPPTGVRMTVGTHKLTLDDTTDLSYIVIPTASTTNRVVSITSNPSGIVDIRYKYDENHGDEFDFGYGDGIIIAENIGTTTITITTSNGKTAEIPFEVLSNIEVTGMALHPLAFAIRKGKEIPFDYGVIPYYATNTNVDIVTFDPSIVSYNPVTKIFKAENEGTTRVTFYAQEDHAINKWAQVTVLPEEEEEEEDPVEYNVLIRARGVKGGEHMYLAVGADDLDHTEGDWTVTTSSADYTAIVRVEGDVYVGYDNDDDISNGMDLIVEYIEISVGDNMEHRASTDYPDNTGSWGSGGCGTGGASQTLNCMGRINFGSILIPGSGGSNQSNKVEFSAMGTTGTEHLSLTIDGVSVGTGWNLSTNMETYSTTIYGDGLINIVYDNDAENRDVRLDYVEVNRIKRETEEMNINTAAYGNGYCGGGSHTEWLNCNGNVDFGYISGKTAHTITIRARGNAGGEHMNLLIDGEPVNSGWWLGTSYVENSVTVYGDGDINVEFDNDGDLRDLVVDWVKVDDQNERQAENMEYNTGAYANGYCGGGSYTQWLHCNGVIGFGNITDNFKSAPAKISEDEISLFNVYPNPSTGEVFIQLNSDEDINSVNLISVTGQIVRTITNISDNKIYFSGLEKGIYIINIKSTNGNFNKKLIVN